MPRHQVGRAVLFSCLTLLTTPILSAEVEAISWTKNVDEAYKIASESGRPLVIYATMNRCPYCTKMKNNTLSDPQVIKQLNEGFIPVYLHVSENPKWVRRLRVKTFPTSLFLTPDGKIHERTTGYVRSQRYLQKLQDLKTASLPSR